MTPAKQPAGSPPPSTRQDAVRIVVERVRRAGRAWSEQPVRSRLRVVRRFRGALAREAPALLRTVSDSRRRDGADTLAGEIVPLADACRFLERRAGRILRPVHSGRRGRPAWLYGVRLEIRREPLGVVLILGASNYPILLPGVQLLQALVAGNGVLMKPGAGGTAASRMLRRLLVDSGLDPDLVELLPEETEAARQAIVTGVDRVLLTGSAETGKEVLRDLADHLTPATLELSGCDAVFVRPEADLDLVAGSLRFGLGFNHGATCIGPRRVFVPRAIAADLELRLRDGLGSLPHVEVDAPVEQRVRRLVSRAEARGARLVLPPGQSPGRMGPVLLAGVEPEMEIARSDLFAPVLMLMPVSDEEDALARNEACPLALGASVFGDESAARALARRIPAGVVMVNDVIVPTADPRLPFGGRRASGFGVTRGAEGLLQLTAVKAIASRRARWRRHLDPPRAGDAPLFSAWLRAAHGATWTDRILGLRDLLSAALRHGKTPLVEQEKER